MNFITLLICLALLCGCSSNTDFSTVEESGAGSTAEQGTSIVSNTSFSEEQGDTITGYHVTNGMLYYYDLPVELDVEELSLKDTELSDYTVLSQFVHLKELYLDGSSVSDLSFLRSMPQLENLSLMRCGNITDFSDVEGCTQLNRLVLSGCTLEQLPDMSLLSNLEVLLLTDTPNLSSLKGIEVLTNLKCLDLSFSNLNDISQISALEHLEYLNLCRCRNVEDFSALSHLHHITTLELSLTSFSDLNLITSMEHLESLCLIETEVQDYSPLLDYDFPNLADLQCEVEGATAETLYDRYGDAFRTPEVIE